MQKDVVAILHNIRSTHNVGSIFRTADAAGVSKLYLTGYTPAPIDRFGRPQKDIAKTALGAENTVDWEANIDVMAAISQLRKDGYVIVALEQDSRSVPYRKAAAGEKLAIILGNEVDGIEKELLDGADAIAEIPMQGEKESLNVSVAAGVMFFALLD